MGSAFTRVTLWFIVTLCDGVPLFTLLFYHYRNFKDERENVGDTVMYTDSSEEMSEDDDRDGKKYGGWQSRRTPLVDSEVERDLNSTMKIQHNSYQSGYNEEEFAAASTAAGTY